MHYWDKEHPAHRAYQAWYSMRYRCRNPKCKEYARYGGRGIRVCDRWQVFSNFLADMGIPPAGLSIDRIDNDGNYEPSNCRWATPLQQSHNSRRPKWLTINGVSRSQLAWARELGVHKSTVTRWIQRGWRGQHATPDRRRNRTLRADGAF